MGKYIVRRILQMIPVVLGATFIIFAMVFALPGDPTAGKCGERPCSPEYVAAFREEHNLNDPLPVQYGKYLGKFVQGDLGTNYYGIPVKEDLAKRYTITGRLAVMAIVFEIVIGILAGVLAGEPQPVSPPGCIAEHGIDGGREAGQRGRLQIGILVGRRMVERPAEQVDRRAHAARRQAEHLLVAVDHGAVPLTLRLDPAQGAGGGPQPELS